MGMCCSARLFGVDGLGVFGAVLLLVLLLLTRAEAVRVADGALVAPLIGFLRLKDGSQLG
jgi:multisubunit Na+/H+ antiporter MnhF subunit